MRILIKIDCNGPAFDGRHCGREIREVLNGLHFVGLSKADILSLDNTPITDGTDAVCGQLRVQP